MIEKLYTQATVYTVPNWQKTEEHAEVLAKIKAMLKYISFIQQDSIRVEKGFSNFWNGSRRKKVFPRYFDREKAENLYECFYGERIGTSYLGYFYQITFLVAGNIRRVIDVVTKDQYLEGLNFLGLTTHVKTFETYRDCGFFYMCAEHCEEGPGARHNPPSPLDVPIGLDVWAATKLIQRLGYEGFTIDLQGLITAVPSKGTVQLLNQKLVRIDNQDRTEGRRTF